MTMRVCVCILSMVAVVSCSTIVPHGRGYAQWQRQIDEVFDLAGNGDSPALLRRTVHETGSVKTPPGGEEPATIQLDGQHTKLSSGTGHKIDMALAGVTHMATWIGAILIFIGVGSFVARWWIPVIPMTASLLVIGAGVGALFMPVVIDRFWWAIPLCACALILLWVHGFLDNRRKMAMTAPSSS